MNPSENENLNRIEELKKKLWSRNYDVKIGHRDSLSQIPQVQVQDSWQDNDNKEVPDPMYRLMNKTSIFKKFFFLSLGFFVLAVLYASYVFFFQENTVSNKNIDISVLGNTFTAGGEELSLVVEIANKNSLPLQAVEMIVEYPKGSEGGLFQDSERMRESIESIPAGDILSKNIKVVLFGEQGSVRPVRIAIEYQVEGSNATFVKEKIYEVTINSIPLSVSVSGPDSANPNQTVTFEISSVLNATKSLPNVLLKVDYPTGFQFSSASPAPSFGNNIWSLGDFSPGSERKISITGKMLEVFEGEEKVFRVWSGSQSPRDKSALEVVFSSVPYAVEIKKPLITAELFVDGKRAIEHAVSSRGAVTAEIRWSNNLDTKINDFVIRAEVSGNAINRRSISPQQGFYNSSLDEIVWDKNSLNRFREINPGDSGSVIFSFSSLPLFSASNGILSNPVIDVEIVAEGKQPTLGYSMQNLSTRESASVKVISDITLSAYGLYYSGPFTNTGPIPPKAEQDTTYTMIWSLSNTSNNISGAKLVTTLPTWVSFIGGVDGEDIIYDQDSRQVTWNIGSVPQGSGIDRKSREGAFRIKLRPSLSQIGSTPNIIGESVLTGRDDFANVDVRVSKSALNTYLTSDPSFPVSGGRVSE